MLGEIIKGCKRFFFVVGMECEMLKGCIIHSLIIVLTGKVSF